MRLKENLTEASVSELESEVAKGTKLGKLVSTPAENLPLKYSRLYVSLTDMIRGKTILDLIKGTIEAWGEDFNFFIRDDSSNLIGWVAFYYIPMSNRVENIKMCSFDVDDTSNNIGIFYNDLLDLIDDLTQSCISVSWYAKYYDDLEIEEIRKKYGNREARKANQLISTYKRIVNKYNGEFSYVDGMIKFSIKKDNEEVDDIDEHLEERLSSIFSRFGSCVRDMKREYVINNSPLSYEETINQLKHIYKDDIIIIKQENITFREYKNNNIRFWIKGDKSIL